MLNIKEQLNNSSDNQILSQITLLSEELSIPSYLVGGYVRDLILKRQTSDIDIMVEGDGILFAQKLSKNHEIKIVSHQDDYDIFFCFIEPTSIVD